MQTISIKSTKSFNIEIDSIASDKSISHRCAIFSMLSDKPSKIKNFLMAEDTMNSLSIVKSLGAKIEFNDNILTIVPPTNIIEPDRVLDCGNSGTGMRLFCGFLASTNGSFVLVGDKYLHSRPMQRVIKPLISIGATLDGRDNGNYAPIHIRGGDIKAFKYSSSVASAQVKSAMILAALRADGDSNYSEPELSRDHSERMLRGMGANIELINGTINIKPLTTPLAPLNISVPSDPSSAFFFAVAAAIIPKSKVLIKNVTLNKTRIEAYHILKKMGAKVEFILKDDKYEPIGDISVEYAPLTGVEVSKNISWLIDELPALSIAFAMAKGTSIIKNAKELRVKESDRISTVVDALNLCGIKSKEFDDGYSVEGGKLKCATISSSGDHRIAMSFAIAGLVSSITIEDTECISTSFPNFIDILFTITKVGINES